MRINEENGHKVWSNYTESKEIFTQCAELSNLSPFMVKYIYEIIYSSVIHILSNKALDSDHKLNKFSIEIPLIGLMTFEINKVKNEVELTGFEPEQSFNDDLIKAVSSGDSPLSSAINKRISDRIKKRYKELL